MPTAASISDSMSASMTSVTSPLPAGGVTLPERQPLYVDPRWTRRRKIWKISIISLLAAVFLAVMALHAVIAWVLARPDVAPLKSNPMAQIGLPYKDVTIPSLNGLSEIEGWHIPAASDRAVIFSHGYGANREEEWIPLYTLAEQLHQHGFHVLMFDYGYVRGTDGRVMTGGVQESQELLGAVRYMKEHGMRSVYVWGFSMGGGSALQAALHEADIDGMILDSAFVPSDETLYHNVRQVVDLPKFPSVALIRFFSSVLNGTSMSQVPVKAMMSTSYPMPILFIHGDSDHRAPVGIIKQIASRQQNPLSSLWILPNGQHELLYRAEPETYLGKAFTFFEAVDKDAVASR